MGLFGKIFGGGESYSDKLAREAAAQTPATPPAPLTAGATIMIVDDIFTIKGRGTIVTGTITSGPLSVGQQVRIVGPQGTISSTIMAIEAFRRASNTANVGDQAGLLLSDVTKEQISQGSTVAAA